MQVCGDELNPHGLVHPKNLKASGCLTVDFQESGRNSNQVVGELPTSGWISKQWLEIHPRGWISDHV